ncbi:MAG: hypothetical protein ACREL1_06265 [bacterium]
MKYPLIFKFKSAVPGENYLAGVMVQGRIVMTEQYGKWWAYGVCPGGLAESGDSPSEAYFNFKDAFWDIVKDIACEQKDYDSFVSSLNEFVQAKNEAEEKDWLGARQAIRDGKLQSGDPFSGLHHIIDDVSCNVSVQRLEETKLTVNITAEDLLIAQVA